MIAVVSDVVARPFRYLGLRIPYGTSTLFNRENFMLLKKFDISGWFRVSARNLLNMSGQTWFSRCMRASMYLS